MTTQIEPRVIDFGSPDDDYQAVLTALRGGRPGIQPYAPGRVRTAHPMADLSGVNTVALENIRGVARRVLFSPRRRCRPTRSS